MAVVIRHATAADLPALRTIFDYVDACHQTALPHVFQRIEGSHRSDEFVLACVQNSAGILLIAERDARPVGLIYAIERMPPEISPFVPRRFAVVDSLAVLPEAQHEGIATDLLEQAERWAQGRGLAEIELSVYEFNTGAKSLYSRLGYDSIRRTMVKSLGTHSDGSEATREAGR